MGCGIGCECMKCGYSFQADFGVGFMFPYEYKKVMEDMKSGRSGSDAQKFIQEHPDGAVNIELVVKQCEQCGDLVNEKDMTMYLPKERYSQEKKGIWSVAVPAEDVEYVSPFELEDNYEKYKQAERSCSKCGHEGFRIFSSDEFTDAVSSGKILCPVCGNKLSVTDFINWD